ncbi:hypothetical protein Bca4012_024548 [Brassica carinata]
MEVEKDDSSSDEGVGAGSKHNKKCSAPSSSSKKSVSKSSQKDLPSECKCCLVDCGDKLREAMHQGKCGNYLSLHIYYVYH